MRIEVVIIGVRVESRFSTLEVWSTQGVYSYHVSKPWCVLGRIQAGIRPAYRKTCPQPEKQMTSDFPQPVFEPLDFQELPPDEMSARAREFLVQARRRRTVRDFSPRPVPRSIIEDCLLTAGTAPSGANLQPWQFVAISDASIKHQIRIEAEREERAFYEHRAPKEWLEALAPLGTDPNKPFLEAAPWLIAIFQQRFGLTASGKKVKHYYPAESVGLATGMLIAAIHNAGLACLTHTPSPMGFLSRILERPKNERPFLLLVVGYPAADAKVPVIGKKSLEEITRFL
jgi:iodotyrosine deiodinase